MKIKYLKLKSWLIVALGGLVGINFSCDKHGFWDDDAPNAYGCPTMNFYHYNVNGTVTNEQGQPIAGIGVRLAEDEEYGYWYRDTTDADGRYSLNYTRTYIDNSYIRFDDIDGVENGNYQDTVATVEVSASDFHGGDGNQDRGTADITQNMVMTEKTNK